jgi:hypothetical protein
MRTINDMRTTQAIVDSIDTRLRELNQEIETLTAARTALDGREDGPSDAGAPAATARRTSRRRSGAGTRRSRRRSTRTAEVVPAGRLESLLSENGGLTTSVLAERTNGDRDQVLTLLRELEAEGRIRRSGQRRSVRWHAITDEDRIRQRAAELAARSSRKRN